MLTQYSTSRWNFFNVACSIQVRVQGGKRTSASTTDAIKITKPKLSDAKFEGADVDTDFMKLARVQQAVF